MKTTPKKPLPTLEQIINNHLDDIDYMALNLQNLVISDTLKTPLPLPLPLPIHRKNFNLVSKLSTSKHLPLHQPLPPKPTTLLPKQLKKSPSLKPTIQIPATPSQTPTKKSQSPSKTEMNHSTLSSSTISFKNKLSLSSKINEKTLSRFLFQFQVPGNKLSPTKGGVKTISIPVDKIHTLENNIYLNKNRDGSGGKGKYRSYLTEPLNIESKPIMMEVKRGKMKTMNEEECGRPRSCYVRVSGGRRQKTEFQEYPWELKPWGTNSRDRNKDKDVSQF